MIEVICCLLTIVDVCILVFIIREYSYTEIIYKNTLKATTTQFAKITKIKKGK